ncbi:MAG TPA: cation transporter [Cyclobacteriaceae bacterium]|nr:cation transporter [Cyclobacteriaceae bacterium]
MNSEVTLQPIEKKYYNIAYWLGIFTIIYNLIEGIIATFLGFEDETLALFGFGLDSFIEMISGMGIVYMITRIQKYPHSEKSEFEKTALRITGYSFYALVAGLTISSIINLINGHKPETTFWGVVISCISIVVMLFLIYGKVKVGNELNSPAILADASCTKICVYMSCILLASSGIYELTGFVYADSIGTLGLAWFSFQEGKECFEKVNNEGHHCHH